MNFEQSNNLFKELEKIYRSFHKKNQMKYGSHMFMIIQIELPTQFGKNNLTCIEEFCSRRRQVWRQHTDTSRSNCIFNLPCRLPTFQYVKRLK